MKEAIRTAAVGALAFVVSQLFAPVSDGHRWFLNSGGGIIGFVGYLFVNGALEISFPLSSSWVWGC